MRGLARLASPVMMFIPFKFKASRALSRLTRFQSFVQGLLTVSCLTSLASAADFQAALSLPKLTENAVFRDRLEAKWLNDGKSFWYRVQTGPESHEFVLIQTATGERKVAPDLQSLLGIDAESPQKTSTLKIEMQATKKTGMSSSLKFINQLESDVELFWINPKGEHVRYGGIRAQSDREMSTYEGHVWLITTRTGETLAAIQAQAIPQAIVIDGKGISKPQEKPAEKERGTPSPDGKWTAEIAQGKVLLRDLHTGKPSVLKLHLDASFPFHGRCVWSPNSRAFVAISAAPVKTRRVTIVESSPKDQSQPRVREFDYAKPGDELPQPFPVLFRLQEGGFEGVRVQNDLFPQAFKQSPLMDIRWSADGREFYFDYNQRGHQLYRVLAADAQTGNVRVITEEKSQTFIDYTQKTWRQWLDKTNELLWMSERDGWCHLWLYDVKTGQPKNAVTKGTWPVREVLHVDETQRVVWFMASGLRAKEDPYHKHLCRVNFDGSGFKQLTESDGQHRVDFSPDRNHFIAIWSRADHVPVHELRRSADGRLVTILEKADASRLLATGWSLPERLVAKGRNGKTDIHGILIKPTHFDPKKRYPVVEEIYAGPHSAFSPKEFGRLLRQHQLAELGFIIVQMDGMGTNHRGKAFHDVCWKNLKDAGFLDRRAWIQTAAQTRPWMDLSRVGIYGGSAGGQSAMRAVLDHYDFYHVAVADCGCHDNRMDKIWWNEQWMGWPIDASYAQSSNVDDAHKLQGKLLLIVGELDDNVDPASTTQVVAQLQHAEKNFEYMPIINTGHGAAETPFGSRLRMEFLVKHLLGER